MSDADFIVAPQVEGDPFGVHGSFGATGTPAAMARLRQKHDLLNAVASWIVVNHPDDIPEIIRLWCRDKDFAASAFADMLLQRDMLIERMSEEDE